MDFALTEEQRMIQDTARRLAEKEIKPVAAALDAEIRFPDEICRRMAELGLLGGTVSPEYDGSGMDYVSYALALMEISKACASCGCILATHNSLFCYPVSAFGTEEQKKKYLAPAARGEKIGCFGLTEPGAGSDAGGVRTKAVEDGDSWILNGGKIFITNGMAASLCCLAALTEPDQGARGISSFIVDLDNTPGFSRRPMENKLGIKASGTAELIFEDARIPKENLLGVRGNGLRQMLTTLDGGRIGIASQAVGVGKAIIEEAIEYAQTREQFGGPIAKFQAIQFKLADMATQMDAAELLILRAAWRADNGLSYEKEAAMAKMYGSDVAMHAAVEGIQILGGYGYFNEYPMERHLRDIKITQIYEGTNEIQRLVIARNLLKKK